MQGHTHTSPKSKHNANSDVVPQLNRVSRATIQAHAQEVPQTLEQVKQKRLQQERLGFNIGNLFTTGQNIQRFDAPASEEEERDQTSQAPLIQRVEIPSAEEQEKEQDQTSQAPLIQKVEASSGEEEQTEPVQSVGPSQKTGVSSHLQTIDGHETGTVQRLCESCGEELSEKKEKEEIQTKLTIGQTERTSNNKSQTHSNLETQLNGSKGGGSPLPDEVRGFMEPRFGADFSHVRTHTDSAAVQMSHSLRAQAFTHGNDIYFGEGRSPAKDQLTAHELTHVIQQTGTVQRFKIGGKIGSAFKKVTSKIGGAVKKVVGKIGSGLKTVGGKIGGAVKKVVGKIGSGLKTVGGKIKGGLKKAIFLAACLGAGPLAFALSPMGWMFKQLIMEAPLPLVRQLMFGGPIRMTKAAVSMRSRMGMYETGIGINGKIASQLFSERILDNPYVTNEMIEKMETVSLSSIKCSDPEYVLKEYPNIRKHPLHRFSVSLYAMATGIAPEKISEKGPDIGLTGSPDLALYKSGVVLSDKMIISSGVSEGTALHDFTADMEAAGVKGLDFAVWGVPGGDKKVSAIMMALQSGPIGAWEAACGMMHGFARKKGWI